jgi:hypothetical protein
LKTILSVAEVRLQRSGVVACIRQRVPARVPEHVSVDLDPQLRILPSALGHSREAGCGERSPAFTDKDERS